METYAIKIQDQRGITLYNLGQFANIDEAYNEAIKQYVWFRIEPNKYEIATY